MDNPGSVMRIRSAAMAREHCLRMPSALEASEAAEGT